MKFLDAGWLLKDAAMKFLADRCQSWGASIAFYTILSLSPLLVAVVAVAGFVFGNEEAAQGIIAQFKEVVGEQAATIVEQVIKGSAESDYGTLAGIIGGVMLLFGASMVFTELQTALNAIWNVPVKEQEKAKSSGILMTVYEKLMSFSLVAGTAFLLLISMVVNAALTAITDGISGWMPEWTNLAWVLNFVVTIVLISAMFAMIFKVLPATTLAWSDTVIGAVVTALLFGLGRYLIGLYLGQAAVGDAYGAAGALVIMLVWVYYSTQIVLFGAELTFLYATRYGSGVWTASGKKIDDPAFAEKAAAGAAGGPNDPAGETNPIARNEKNAVDEFAAEAEKVHGRDD